MLSTQHTEILRIRNILQKYCIVFAGFIVISVGGSFFMPDNVSNDRAPLDILLMVAAGCAALMATILGVSLERENEHHLAWVWTRPASRTGYALGLFIVDVMGIAGAYLLALGWCFLTEILPGPHSQGLQSIDYSTTPLFVIATIVFPIAVYGVLQFATASMKGGVAWVASIYWPVAGALYGLDLLGQSLGPRGNLVLWTAEFIDHVNPLNLFINVIAHPLASSLGNPITEVQPPNEMTISLVVLGLVALAGMALALAQWNRVEA